MKKLSELRPDKSLLNPNFNGYKLSLASIPSYNLAFEKGVDQVSPSDDQYSFLYAKLFSLHNYLIADKWNEGHLYFIDKDWKIQKIVMNESDLVEKTEAVWEIPSNHKRAPGHYFPSISFPSQDLAVVADGAGTLHIISRKTTWEANYSEEVIGKETPFVVYDSQCEETDSQCVLHCLVVHVKSEEDPKEGDPSNRYVTVIDWLSLLQESSGSWSMKNIRQLQGSGLPDYITLEPGCKNIYLVNESPFKFISDSENPVVVEEIDDKKSNIPDSEKLYKWQQNDEEIKLSFEFENKIEKSEIKIIATCNNFSLKYKEKLILSGSLFHRIDNDLTLWTLQDNKLEVTVQKEEKGTMWREFVTGDSHGEEVLDESVVSEVHQRLSHLCSDTPVRVKDIDVCGSAPSFNMEQLEDCDSTPGEYKVLMRVDGVTHEITGEIGASNINRTLFIHQVKDIDVCGSAPSFNMEQLEDCDSTPGEYKVLMRVDGVTHEVTGEYTLAGHQWLFSIEQSTSSAAAICIRHDVDACVWQPRAVTNPPAAPWPCQHIGTFYAFGYVQASKQNKKFLLSPPVSQQHFGHGVYRIECGQA
ncbi:LOW QUALITY PROTEIN: nudC domain-containing protein 1 [Nilaparvata lugens]|uniref:LOW QUALITY PROTEIN: nudC domain-containing protein 1 n=1 Tax=Nilaparvata lugens TaxID=108931 RepID=UPI00193E38F4|nr:LOW QUALITY PROTEIN: nudC domain-containing protein 1 [Nilaparvata lugens]